MSRVLLGGRYADQLDRPLRDLGLSPLYLPDNPSVDPRLAGHADLSVFPAEGERIYLAPYLRGSETARSLQQAGYSVLFPDIRQGSVYPADAQLNLCTLGRTVLYGKDSACPDIVRYLTSRRGYRPVPVRQGYTRCAVCPVDGESLITADRGVARTATELGLTVLIVTPGFVSLPGFADGFLGGAAIPLGDGRLAFTGNLDAHPDRNWILDFLRRRGVEPVFLTGLPVFDIGSAFVLK